MSRNDDLRSALLAILMWFNEAEARELAQDQIVLLVGGRLPDAAVLRRLTELIGAAPDRALHADVWRAKKTLTESLI